jgi:transposase
MEERSKKLIRGGTTMGFLDESYFCSTPFVARTWAPIGETPVVVHPFNWDHVSAISVITTTGKLYFRLHPNKSITGDKIVIFLRHFLRQVRGNIILYWDGVPPHKSKKVKEFIDQHPRLQIRRLPPYSPDLNPDEGVWDYVKTRELPNLTVKDTTELIRKVRGALRKMQRRPMLIKSFLFESELLWDYETHQFIAQSS